MITNEDINKLPVESFSGEIILVETEEQSIKACEMLDSYIYIGFDTESKPTFKKGIKSKLSLIQLALDDVCYLFRVSKMKNIPNELINLFNNEKKVFIGLSIKDDLQKIRTKATVNSSNFIELQDVVKKMNLEEQSLKKIYARLFSKKISKKQQLSNWNNSNLSEAQKIYAATDAWACLKIYNKLENIKQI